MGVNMVIPLPKVLKSIQDFIGHSLQIFPGAVQRALCDEKGTNIYSALYTHY